MIDYYKPRNTPDALLLLLFLLLLFIVLFFSSCSAEWYIARAIKKNPNILKADTVQVLDTLYIGEISYDTTIISNTIDTILIEKERLRIKIMKYYDTLKIEGTCIADTVINIVRIPVERVVYAPKKWYEKHWWILIIVATAIGVMLRR